MAENGGIHNGDLASMPMLGEKETHSSMSKTFRFSTLASNLGPFLRHGRRGMGLALGALIGVLVLFSHSRYQGISTSPRAIIKGGWQKANAAANVVLQGPNSYDGFNNYVKNDVCNFTTQDLHHAFRPLCNERTQLLEAMSGGGRIGWDVPYQPRECDMQWFSTWDICKILNRFDNIYFVGDSLLRHTIQAMNVLIREDLVNGGKATWKADEEDSPFTCTCQEAFDQIGCVFRSAINTEDIIKGDPASIRCPANKPPANVQWIPTLNFPLEGLKLKDWISSIPHKNEPNGRNAYVMGHGIWNDFEAETTMQWLEQIEDAMRIQMPAYFEPDVDQWRFPRLFMSSSAQGEGKPSLFHWNQNNLRLQRHTREISSFARDRGYEHLGMYNLTVQATSPDGSHASMQNNIMKAMMVLNWLNMIDPPEADNPKPDLPSKPSGIPQGAVPADWVKEVAPMDAVATTLDSSLEIITTAPTSTDQISYAQPAPTKHPVDDLIEDAEKEYHTLLGREKKGVKDASAAYREKRGRHPPPNFDKWVEYAEKHDVLLIEDFFDQMYNDIDPFWGLPAEDMRKFPASWADTISIRDGKLYRWEDERPNIALWPDYFARGLEMLPLDEIPDIDLAFNGQDEPKIFTPWETIKNYKSEGDSRKHIDKPTGNKPIISDFKRLDKLPSTRPRGNDAFQYDLYEEDAPLWPLAREACEDASARNSPQIRDYSVPPVFPNSSLSYMHQGYVKDWAKAKSTCVNPELRNLHGTFIGMLSSDIDNETPHQKAVSTKLVPLLSGCKIHDINSEILVPPAMQWPSEVADAEESDFGFNFKENRRVLWEDKQDLVMWRGSASGGINTADDWTRFPRHRFIAMLNGSLVESHQQVSQQPLPVHVPGGKPPLPHNFPLPNNELYPLAALEEQAPAQTLGNWISSISDAAFIHLRCFPPITWFQGNGQDCPYSSPFYEVKHVITAAESYKYKYHPDIDGASYSGRYRSILYSNSLPMKATIYDEWHDSRLIPWRHFVPMDNTNVDWWGLLEYFFGYKDKRASHDEAAKRIAEEGSKWARKVLRNEDMLAYMYRLILELARLSDDERDQMGYVADLEA